MPKIVLLGTYCEQTHLTIYTISDDFYLELIETIISFQQQSSKYIFKHSN